MHPLDKLIRVIPDWPIPGVMFQDLTGVLADGEGLSQIGKDLAEAFSDSKIDVVAGMEARGFIVGTTVARELGVGFLAVRKAGKLPGAVHSTTYDLEYGTAELQIHQADLQPGMKVLIIDDVLATGGTAAATAELISRTGAEVVGLGFVLELDFLNGASKLEGHRIHSLRVVTA